METELHRPMCRVLNLSVSYKLQNLRYVDEIYNYSGYPAYNTTVTEVNEKFTLKYFCINIGITL